MKWEKEEVLGEMVTVVFVFYININFFNLKEEFFGKLWIYYCYLCYIISFFVRVMIVFFWFFFIIIESLCIIIDF